MLLIGRYLGNALHCFTVLQQQRGSAAAAAAAAAAAEQSLTKSKVFDAITEAGHILNIQR